MLHDLLPYRSQYVVQSYYVSEELFNVRILQKDRLKVNDEDLFIGINVWNSRVGRSSLNISILVYKQVCVNGVIVQKNQEEFYIQRHVGIGRKRKPLTKPSRPSRGNTKNTVTTAGDF